MSFNLNKTGSVIRTGTRRSNLILTGSGSNPLETVFQSSTRLYLCSYMAPVLLQYTHQSCKHIQNWNIGLQPKIDIHLIISNREGPSSRSYFNINRLIQQNRPLICLSINRVNSLVDGVWLQL